jgi:hypothetical protein
MRSVVGCRNLEYSFCLLMRVLNRKAAFYNHKLIKVKFVSNMLAQKAI